MPLSKFKMATNHSKLNIADIEGAQAKISNRKEGNFSLVTEDVSVI